MYSSIKRVSERKHGILTQCITLKSAKKANPQLCAMVLMKINAKLGGIAVKVHWDGLKNSRKSYIILKIRFFDIQQQPRIIKKFVLNNSPGWIILCKIIHQAARIQNFTSLNSECIQLGIFVNSELRNRTNDRYSRLFYTMFDV